MIQQIKAVHIGPPAEITPLPNHTGPSAPNWQRPHYVERVESVVPWTGVERRASVTDNAKITIEQAAQNLIKLAERRGLDVSVNKRRKDLEAEDPPTAMILSHSQDYEYVINITPKS